MQNFHKKKKKTWGKLGVTDKDLERQPSNKYYWAKVLV